LSAVKGRGALARYDRPVSRTGHLARRAEAFARELATWREGDPPALHTVAERLHEMLPADIAGAYALAPAGAGLRVEFVHFHGYPSRAYARDLDALVGETPVGWACYNPIRPEPTQRNAVVELHPRVATASQERIPAARTMIERHPLLRSAHQLRALVCDGPALVAWVGAMREGGFRPGDRARLRRLLPAIQRRLATERRAALGGVAIAAFDALLERVAGAGFLADARGAIVHASSAGAALLARRGDAARAEVRDAALGRPQRRYDVTRVESAGVPAYALLVERAPEPDAAARALQLASRVALTPRQQQVLEQLAKGHANKTIAALLGVSEGAVELHVTALLARFGCESRSALVARFWTA
jgi:DNA-binding CsgD family transcriptional regulator